MVGCFACCERTPGVVVAGRGNEDGESDKKSASDVRRPSPALRHLPSPARGVAISRRENLVPKLLFGNELMIANLVGPPFVSLQLGTRFVILPREEIGPTEWFGRRRATPRASLRE